MTVESSSPHPAHSSPPGDPNADGAKGTLPITIAIGALLGLILVGLSIGSDRFAGLSNPSIAIETNGLPIRESRDMLLPTSGWTLQIGLPEDLSQAVRETLRVTLRAERSGAIVDVTDQLETRDAGLTLRIAESLGLSTGLLSITASLEDAENRKLEAHRRLRIRSWLGGPPIGSRQIVHFDFEADRDGDGLRDFEGDLIRFGLGSPEAPVLSAALADQIASLALARVRRAYDSRSDPNRTGRDRDPVFVRFELAAKASPFVTRICVGGRNLLHPGSVGYVRYDPSNRERRSESCGVGDESSGIFPSEFESYTESMLFRRTFGPFMGSRGGSPFGTRPGDGALLEALPPSIDRAPGAIPPEPEKGDRQAQLLRAAWIFGHALGSVMAHESGHALGLVPEGKPGVGLFGGSDPANERYAHNLDPNVVDPSAADAREVPETIPWLMNAGARLDFEDLAGLGPAGELQFRPLNYAYLKDRVVLSGDRRARK